MPEPAVIPSRQILKGFCRSVWAADIEGTIIAVKHEDRGPGRWRVAQGAAYSLVLPKRLHKINLEAGIEASASRTDPLRQCGTTVWMVRLNT